MTDQDPSPSPRRALVFAFRRGGAWEETSVFALRALRPFVEAILVVAPEGVGAIPPGAAGLVDRVVATGSEDFSSRAYVEAIEAAREVLPHLEEVILTGDSWFGPLEGVGDVFDRMSGSADVWTMLPPSPPRPSFPGEGFPAIDDRPWLWTALSRRVIDGDDWRRWWASPVADGDRERRLHTDLADEHRTWSVAFDVADLPLDPGLYAPEDLIERGVPFIDRAVFASFPPFLDRFAILGREIARLMESRGYPLDMLWSSLARVIPPKALNTTAALLEILPDHALSEAAPPLRIAAIVHISDLDGLDDVLRRLDFFPNPVDTFVTTTEGVTAARLERRLEAWSAQRGHHYELRVTPASPGRDMADFFAGCRDLLRPGRYDLVVKVHSRRAPWKTMNRLRYFRRYQLDNLLNSPGYVRNVLELFRSQPRLGLVFPPMIHIGYATMGRGWAELRDSAERLARHLGITVPLDRVSPLAPFGGMWIARPEALRLMVECRWRFADYTLKAQRRFGRLAHVQERLVTAAAAEVGYYSRTVLTYEHAEISHTALDFKVDQISSTTRGWPVERIDFLHRAGYTGYGGTVALARMYVRLNHPAVVERLRPLYRLAFRMFGIAAGVRRLTRRVTDRSREEQRGGAE